jgi:hypothetical protein
MEDMIDRELSCQLQQQKRAAERWDGHQESFDQSVIESHGTF